MQLLRKYAPFLFGEGQLRAAARTRHLAAASASTTRVTKRRTGAKKRVHKARPKRVAGRLTRRTKTIHPKKLAVMAPPRLSTIVRTRKAKSFSMKGPDLSALKAFLTMPLPQLLHDLMKRVQMVEKKIPKTPKKPASLSSVKEAAAGLPVQRKAVSTGPDPFLSNISTKQESVPTFSGPLTLEADSKLRPKTEKVEAAPASRLDADDLLQAMNMKKQESALPTTTESSENLQKKIPEVAFSFFSKKEKRPEQDATKEEKPVEPQKDVFSGPVFKQRKRSDFSAFLSSLKYFGIMKERLNIIQSLSTMLNAGLPIIDSLKALQVEARGRAQKKLFQRIIDSVENGSALWRALDDLDFFSPHSIALIRIGEEAGNLAENMKYLAIQQEKDHQLKQKVQLAMIYPSIVIVLMFAIVMGLGMFVLPNLIKVLYSLNVKLPLVTRLVILFTEIMTTYGAIGIPATIGFMIFIVMLAKFTRLKIVTQWIIFRVPGVGRLAREATIARFGVIMGGLLQAGVPVTESLHSLVEVTSVASYKRLYTRLLEHVTIGDSFSKSFSSIRRCDKLIPASVQQLIVTGEKSGSLAEIFMKVSDIYEKKANDTAQKLPVILEPMILLFIGALVGTIAFAIIVPIYSIVGNVGRG